jgi:hypothetical protein
MKSADGNDIVWLDLPDEGRHVAEVMAIDGLHGTAQVRYIAEHGLILRDVPLSCILDIEPNRLGG